MITMYPFLIYLFYLIHLSRRWWLMGQSRVSFDPFEYIINVSLALVWWKSSPLKCPLVGLRGGRGALIMNIFLSLSWALKIQKKRHFAFTSSDSEDEAHNFPWFLVISPLQNGDKFKNLSPFVVEKVILANIGTPRSVKTMKSGSLLIECDRLQQTKNLLKMKNYK